MPIDPDEAIEKIYYYELERRRALFSRLSIPAGVLTVLAGAIGFLVQRGTELPDLVWFVPYGTLIFIGIFWFLQALIAVFDSARATRLPGPVSPTVIDAVAEYTEPDELSRRLAGSLAVAANSLRRINDEREDKLFNSFQSMLMSTSALILTYGVYLIYTVFDYLVRTSTPS